MPYAYFIHWTHVVRQNGSDAARGFEPRSAPAYERIPDLVGIHSRASVARGAPVPALRELPGGAGAHVVYHRHLLRVKEAGIVVMMAIIPSSSAASNRHQATR